MSELRAAAERVRLDAEPGERWGATVGGLALVVGLSLVDALWEQELPHGRRHRPVPGRAAGTERQTAAVAAAASPRRC